MTSLGPGLFGSMADLPLRVRALPSSASCLVAAMARYNTRRGSGTAQGRQSVLV